MHAQAKSTFVGMLRVLVGAVAVLMLGTFAVPSLANTQGVITALVCTGSHEATWTPGLTSNPATILVGAQTNWSCANVSGGPVILNGASTSSFDATFSCGSIFSPVSTTWTINWKDTNGNPMGQSQYQFTARVTAVENNLVIAAPGTITGGQFAGAAVVGSFTLANLAATVQNGCNIPGGVTNASGLSTLTITGLDLKL